MTIIRIYHRLFITLTATMSAVSTLADNVIDFNEANMGNSAEVVVSDTLPVSESTAAHGDTFVSLTNLIERVRQGDKQAYETLADCYRYGKGGAEKCMFNAIVCYQLAGQKPVDVVEAAFNANPNDELGLMNHLMVIMDKQGLDSLGVALESMDIPDYKWAKLLRNIVANADSDNSRDYILPMVDGNSTGDEFLMAFASLHILTRHLPDLESTPKSLLMAEKVPFMYNHAGEKQWDRYKEDESANKENLDSAIMYFQKADANGFLSPRNARRILSVNARKCADISRYFDKNDIQRLIRIGGPDEDYDEAEVVEMDMNPVEKIEDTESGQVPTL